MLSNWRNPPRPVEKSAGQGSRITGDTGKSVEGERESAGSVVVRKWSNVCGAKRPCCLYGSNKTGGKGEMTRASISFAGPEKESICQGEGRTVLAFLGTIRPRLQDGDFAGSLPDGEKE